MPRPAITWTLAVGGFALVATTSGHATEYLTVEQAQQTLWPGVKLTPVTVHLTPAQLAAIEARGGVRVRRADFTAWRTPDGGWFLVDEVLGKHEFITYACAIEARGTVVGLEILSYRETYGGEIRRLAWRAQFAGKTARDSLQLDHDIKNISGATLSCRHIADGVKRLLATHALVLAKL